MTTKSKKTVENLEKALNSSSVVDSAEKLEMLIERVKKAQKIYSTFTQEQVDAIFKAAATAADKARIPLARMAVEETGMGVLEDKIIKITLLQNTSTTNIKMLKLAELSKKIKLTVLKQLQNLSVLLQVSFLQQTLLQLRFLNL